MTMILLFIDRPQPGCAWYEDPRSPRELMYLVNTCRLCIGLDRAGLNAVDRAQNAFSMPNEGLVSVAFSPHYVDLNERMYQLLFRLYDGDTPAAAAAALGFDMALVEDLLEQMYARFNVKSTPQMLAAAETYGVV